LYNVHLIVVQDRPMLTHLGTDLAACAQERIDPRSVWPMIVFGIKVVCLDESRAAHVEAQPTADTQIKVQFDGRPLPSNFGQQGAGPLRDDDRWRFSLKTTTQGGLYLFEIVGIDGVDMLDAHCPGHVFEPYGEGRLSLERPARAGVMLVAGHGRGAIVDDDGDSVAIVVGHVQERGHTGMEKRRVADNRHVLLPDASLAHAMSYPDAGSHATAGMQRRQRRQKAQRVAANIPVDHQPEFVRDGKDAAMRTAWA
jgi:hypothetical protein